MKGDEEIPYYKMINNTLKQNKNMIKLKKKKMKEKNTNNNKNYIPK